MNKLTDFYARKAALIEKKQPIDLQLEQMEDLLLKEELLPELIQQLKSTLSQVKSPIMFSGCYDPSGVLSVSITRNCVATSVSSTPSALLSPTRKSNPEGSARTRAKSVGFSVTFPDGTIKGKTAVDTFIKALCKIGLKRIAEDKDCPTHHDWRLVGTEKRTDMAKTQRLVDGYYIITKISNNDKIADLLKLSNRFGLNISISTL